MNINRTKWKRLISLLEKKGMSENGLINRNFTYFWIEISWYVLQKKSWYICTYPIGFVEGFKFGFGFGFNFIRLILIIIPFCNKRLIGFANVRQGRRFRDAKDAIEIWRRWTRDLSHEITRREKDKWRFPKERERET